MFRLSSSTPKFFFFSSAPPLCVSSLRFCSSSTSTPAVSAPAQKDEKQQQAQVRAAAAHITAYINLYSSNVNVPKQRVALQAWREIDELPERYIEIADVDSVVKLLNAFTYFRNIWEKGHDGPAKPLPKREGSRTKKDPEEIVIPPEFYMQRNGPGGAGFSMQARPAAKPDHEHGGRGGGGGSGGGGGKKPDRSGFQRRPAGGGAGTNASPEGKSRFASRPSNPKPADVVGEMIE